MSWCFNCRVSSVSQPSLFINPVTLVLQRWSFSVHLAALLNFFSQKYQCYSVYMDSMLRFRIPVLLL